MTVIAANRPVDLPEGVDDATGNPQWGSDVVVDMLRLLGVEYAAVLPGSTFRGIHDSIVNYAGNRAPEIILCNHEMITVSMARGYARVTGRPMAAIVHNFVGLLNTSMTIYDAWCDRVPVLVLGGTGPVDASKRRPWIDWIHTANVQGAAIRDFTKWDDQPASVAAFPESLLRAYRIATTEPAGPVYLCFDVELQEQEIAGSFPLPDIARYRPSAPPPADPAAIREAAALLVDAELPLCFTDRVGRDAASVRLLVELAELLALPVINLGAWHSFPTPHELDFVGMEEELLPEADVVLGLDVVDLDGALRTSDDTRSGSTTAARLTRAQTVINVSLDELMHRGLTSDYQALPTVDLPMLASPRAVLPLLLEECRTRIDAAAATRIDRRRSALADRQARLRERQRAYVQRECAHAGISETRLMVELWAAVQGKPFIFTTGYPRRMAPGVCHLSGPEQSIVGGGGGAVGAHPGVAIGAALALKDSGKIPVAVVGDGHFIASSQALWTAAHYQLPTLWVINNNRSYLNDEHHQGRIAHFRNRPPENRWIGQRIEQPVIDIATLARSYGVTGVGPVKSPGELQEAFQHGLAAVERGETVVVDVWTENRAHG